MAGLEVSMAEVEGFMAGLEVSMAEVEVSTAAEATMATTVDATTAAIEAVEITAGAEAIVAITAGAADMGAIHGTDGGSALDGRIGGGTRIMGIATAPIGMIPTQTKTSTVLPATHALTAETMILHRQRAVQDRTLTAPRNLGGHPSPGALMIPTTL